MLHRKEKQRCYHIEKKNYRCSNLKDKSNPVSYESYDILEDNRIS